MTHHTSATNEKAPGAINTEGLEIDSTNDLNFATGSRRGKAVATQIAKLAIAGHAVHQLADGGYLVCKYGHVHHATDFEALQIFAHRLGVNK
ncbi:hypothetical protein [Rhodoferax sp.]|uniref:hypothetical protein n=1 Tax=Rhodoferax sp. TaxID=50421 RepID=UPI00274A7CA3|nr:hypothetical protein [Rhodoferax sp.]